MTFEKAWAKLLETHFSEMPEHVREVVKPSYELVYNAGYSEGACDTMARYVELTSTITGELRQSYRG